MKKYFLRLNDNQRIIYLALLLTLSIMILTLPLAIIDLYGIPLGLLLGGIIGVVNFWLLVRQMNNLINNATNSKLGNVLNIIFRYAIYALGLASAAVLMKLGYNIFNIFAVLGGYLLIKVIVIFYYGRRNQGGEQ